MKRQSLAACARWKDKLMVHAGTLSIDEQTALLEHLDTCHSCREQYNSYQRIIADLQRLSSCLQPLEQQKRLQQIKLYHAQNRRHRAHFRPTSFTHFFNPFSKHRPRYFNMAYTFIAIIIIAVIVIPWHSAQASGLTLQYMASKPPGDPGAWAHKVSWSFNGEDIASLWDNNIMQVWNAHTGKESFHITVGWGAGLAFSPDGKYLASIDTDGTIQVLDVATCKVSSIECKKQATIYQGHSAPINDLAWSPDSSKIVSASDDKTVQVWEAHTGKWLYTYQDTTYQDTTSQGKFTAVAWSRDGRRIVSGDENGHVQIWDALTGGHPLSYSGHIGDPITFLSWSPDSKYIVSSGYKGTARVWNAKTGETINLLPSSGKASTIDNQNDPIYAAIWSPNGLWIVLASYDTIQVCNAMNGEQVAVYHPSKYLSASQQPHDNDVFTVAWSHDGKYIVSGGQGFVLTLNLR